MVDARKINYCLYNKITTFAILTYKTTKSIIFITYLNCNFCGELYMMTNELNNHSFKSPSNADFDTLVSQYYDWILEYNAENDEIEFLHISNEFIERGFIPEQIKFFDELNQLFAKSMVVTEEHAVYLEQVSLPNILCETESKGCFIRTVHTNTFDGIKAKDLRITPIKNIKHRFLICLMDISMILNRDWMTDEYSRSGFIAKVEQLLNDPAYRTNYSIVYTNIQAFKAINDIIGTQNGDMIIFSTCSTLLNELNPVLIARLESDHFAVFTKTENITEEKMTRICHQSYTYNTKHLSYIIRCGIYNINDHTKKIPYMLDQAKLAETSIPADQAIPYAVFDEKLNREYINQRMFVAELDSALKKEEFVPYYQPIVDAKTYEIVSAEALIRWIHSEKGLIPPGQFIPIFEKEGLTSKLASFMINRILTFNTKLKKNGKKNIPCSVNLSRVDFYDTNLLNFLKQQFQSKEDVANIIKLEITESAYVTLGSCAFAFLEEMKKLNLSVLLDDFGNGMSSLSTLELYDFDIIKLDMGFVKKIGNNPKAEAIIRHTIGLAHTLGAKVVAEGVETKEQLDFLQSVDCDMIQGYFFHKPLPEEEFFKLL